MHEFQNSQIPAEHRNIIPDMFDKHISGQQPVQFFNVRREVLSAIRKCAKPPVLVPVKRTDGDKDYFVVEFDVEPVAEVCGTTVFYRRLNPKKCKPRSNAEK